MRSCITAEIDLDERGQDDDVDRLGDGGHEESLCSASLWERIRAGSARHGIALLRDIIEDGGDLFELDSSGRSCAHRAIEADRGWELHFLLAIERTARRRNAELLSPQQTLLELCDAGGRAPLHLAADGGFVALTRYLTKAWQGNSINARDAQGRTPLFLAAGRGHLAVVKLLLKGGADLNIQDRQERTAMHAAAEGGHSAVEELLGMAQRRLQRLLNPIPGVVALFRCEASYALDRKLTPSAYALADVYEPPPLRPRVVRIMFALPLALSAAVLFLPLLYGVLLVVSASIAARALTLRWLREGTANERDIGAGFWRGSVATWGALCGAAWLVEPLSVLCPGVLQQFGVCCWAAGYLCMLAALFATCGADPGVVELDDDSLSFAMQHVLEHGAPPSDFHPTQILRRPLRSKLCRESGGACIARFDHFCIWINRPIGAGNHVLFLTFVALHAGALLAALLVLLSMLGVAAELRGGLSSLAAAPVPGLLLLFAFGVLVEASLLWLLAAQLRNLAANLTTNERVNLERYPHFWKTDAGRRVFFNPFDRGLFENVNEIFGISGRVHYVPLFASPDAADQLLHARDDGDGDDDDDEQRGTLLARQNQLEVLVVPSGWNSSEDAGGRWLPPALPLSMHSSPDPAALASAKAS